MLAMSAPERRLILPTEVPEIELRQLQLQDAPAYFDAIDADRDHLSQHGDVTAGKYPALNDVVDSILKPLDPERIRMGIWRNDEVLTGSINLDPDGQIGYWISKPHVRQGIATVALRAMARYGRAHRDNVYATVHVNNDASVGVLMKASFFLSNEAHDTKIFEYLGE